MLTLDDYQKAFREMLARALDSELSREVKPMSSQLQRVIEEDAKEMLKRC